MTYHSDGEIVLDSEGKERNREGYAKFSEEDGCIVAVVRCVACGRLYEEEFGSAVTKEERFVDFMCIACDNDALEDAFIDFTDSPDASGGK